MRAPLAALVVLPLLAVPWLSRSETADLSGQYTDHLRHARASRMFFERGLTLHTQPLGDEGKYWTNVPYAYPPGALLLFLPFSSASAQVLVTFTTVLAGLAWAAILAVLFRERRVIVSSAVAAFAFLMLMRTGLEGFYDSAWVGLGVLAILALERKAFHAALGLCVAAALLHLRAAALVPIAGVAFLGLNDRRAWIPVLVLVAALDVWVFAGALPYAETLRGGMAPLYAQPIPLLVSAVLSAAAGVLCFKQGHRLAAACIGVVFLIALADNRAWWHASVVLIPLVLFGARGGHPATAAFLFLWAIQLQRFAWGGRVWDLLVLAAARIRDGLGSS